MNRALPALLLLSLGCPQPTDTDKVLDSNGGYYETGLVDSGETGDTAVDTADSGLDTADSGVDTADSGLDTADTADTGDVEPTLAGLEAWPDDQIVNPGASWTIKVFGTDSVGARGAYSLATYSVDDTAVATVDAAGLVTAVAEGVTTVRVAAEGLEVALTVEVRSALTARITVIDGTTGLPIEGASVYGDAGEATTDASGFAEIPVADGLPATFTAWIDDDHEVVSILGTVNRELTIPLDVLADQEPSAELSGDADYSGVADAAFGELVVGLASASIQGSLLLFNVDDLLASERTINVFGVDADVPSNLFVEGYADDYVANAFPGGVSVWGLAGPIAISDVTSGLSGSGDALELMVNNLDVMTWGITPGLTAVAGATTEAGIAPDTAFSDLVTVALPSLSAGFEGSEELLVITADQRTDEGWVVTGLGIGTGVTDVERIPPGTVPASVQSAVYTMAQVGGIGSGGATSMSVGEDDGGTVVFPELQDVPVVNDYTPGTRSLDFSADPDATLVRARILDAGGRVHELWTDASWAGNFHDNLSGFRRGLADVEVRSYTIDGGTLEHWLRAGDWEPEALNPTTVARVLLVRE